MIETIHKICVCGAGTMGSDIALVAAQHGFSTILYDMDTGVIQQAKEKIENGLSSLVTRNRISASENKNVLDRLIFTVDINDCIADLVIEAIIEKAEAKIDLFTRLAGINNEQAILSSNTSSLPISAIAEKIPNPQRVAGMHFFNPAPVMKLVEIVKTNYSDEETISVLYELAKRMGKTPVICKDAPGFIVNHVARPYYLEALRLVEKGVADYQMIDGLMESSGFRMGPFKLMDLIGNDVNYAVSCSIYEAMGRPERLKPSSIQKEKVANGELGRKTKKGYYHYE
jgi:3-hydroxybutyryl-CoA dehydrogenase